MTDFLRERILALTPAQRDAAIKLLMNAGFARTFEINLLQRPEGVRMRDELLNVEALRTPNPERTGDAIDIFFLAFLTDPELCNRRGDVLSPQTLTEVNAVLSGVLFPEQVEKTRAA